MDLAAVLNTLEDKYYGELEEEREPLVEYLEKMYHKLEVNPELLEEFLKRSIRHFGGAYIPYVFWRQLNAFIDNPEDGRLFLQEILKAFADSDFEEQEQRKMKPLVVTYFTLEKEFELNKFNTLVVDKLHPAVREYYRGLQEFIEKNARATALYKEKYLMLRRQNPDFDLFDKPVSTLKEMMEGN